MKILLDENMPESLVGALEDLGHEVHSVNHLKLKGLDNGTLYRQVAIHYDPLFYPGYWLCCTMSARCADPSQVKVLRVIVPQQRTGLFVPAFVDAFQRSDWSRYSERRRLALDLSTYIYSVTAAEAAQSRGSEEIFDRFSIAVVIP